MKKKIRLLLSIMIFAFMVCSVVNIQTVQAADTIDQTTETDGTTKPDETTETDGTTKPDETTETDQITETDENTEPEQPVSTWQTVDGQKYYYDSTGTKVTGLKTIDGKKYYFNAKGVMTVSAWKTINEKKYYFGSTGVMATGWKTISGKKYYLYTAGGRAVGWTKISGKTYYFSKTGVLKVGKTNSISSKATRLNGLIINKKGVCTTDGKTATNVMITLNKQIAKDIKAAKMSSSLTDRKKVDALFKYLCSKCTYKHKVINPYSTTFSTSSAKSMLQTGKGNCYCYAAAFAYLVKAATNYETRVSYGVCCIKTGWGRGTYSHGWTEVKIGGKWKIFDVELYDRGSRSSRYSSGKTYAQMRSAGTVYSRSGYVNITL